MVSIEKVLITDAVHESCIQLLKANGIAVDYKLKLSEEELVKEIPVKKYIFLLLS